MKADFTRSTFKAEKHYSGVRMQQGRVQIDADWNEQLDIESHVDRATIADVIGDCGVPKTGDFKIDLTSDGADLSIAPGRIYVDGILCELEATAVSVEFPEDDVTTVKVENLVVDGRDLEIGQWVELTSSKGSEIRKIVDVTNNILTLDSDISTIWDGSNPTLRRITTYLTQPDLPSANASDLDLNKSYVAYLDVWEHHITALEDSDIREVALGGPDTATRTKVVWQVKLLEVPSGTACETETAEWADLVARNSGRLYARATPSTSSTNPCIVAPGAGYRGLENQLYRVEIHSGGAAGTATFKWSRENGSVVSVWTSISGSDLTVSSSATDSVRGFKAGDWVELTDDTRELTNASGTLVQLTKVEGQVLTIDDAVAATISFADYSPNPKIRRWDMSDEGGAITVTTADYIELENGVEIQFESGEYHAGDYWLIPARTSEGDIEWPTDSTGSQLPQAPHGIEHHYCKLAVVSSDLTEDCRPQFPPLTNITASDVSFDDQCEMGATNVQEALDVLCDTYVLRYAGGDGQEAAPGSSLPGPIQVGVEDGVGRPVAGAIVTFTVSAGGGSLRQFGSASPFAGTVTFATGTDGLARCEWRLGALTSNVAVAALAVTPEQERLQIFFLATAETAVAADSGPKIKGINWINDQPLLLARFQKEGLIIDLTDPVLPGTVNPSTFIVTLEVPQSVGDTTTGYKWHLAYILAGSVGRMETTGQERYRFQPIQDQSIPIAWFTDQVRLFGTRRLRCRVTILGNMIFDQAGNFLDGDAYGKQFSAASGSFTGLILPSGDGSKGGRFESWFWLVDQ